MTNKGWKRESTRHAMASRGIKTKTLNAKGLGGGDVYGGMKVKLDVKDVRGKTASFTNKDSAWGKGRLYFITKRYNDGSYLAFWSDSPWGRVHNQDRGWVVIKPKKGSQYGEVIDFVQTYDFGPNPYNEDDDNYKKFMKRNKEEHKGYKESYNDWKMDE